VSISTPLTRPCNRSPIGHARRSLSSLAIPVASQQLALQALDNVCEQQAPALTHFDCFRVFAMIMLALVLLVLLMQRSVAEKGARIGGE
jgi:hypothetical protein